MEGPGQDADGDGNIQIGGDGVVAKDVSGSIIAGGDINVNIDGISPSEHARALAQIEILREKLTISEAANKEQPTPEEVQAAGDAIGAAGELERMGASLDPYDLIKLGNAARLRGRTFPAEGYYREALRLFLEAEDRRGEGASLGSLGIVADSRGDYGEAERLYRESLAIMREIGNRQGEAGSLNNLGALAYNRGDYDEAVRLYRESVRIKNGIGIPLTDWLIENGYTDPDEEWEFPPPRENSE